MNKKSWIGCGVIAVIVCFIGVLTDWRIASGFLLGAVVSVWLYWRTVFFCSAVLEQKSSRKRMIFVRFFGTYALMAIPLLLAAVLPEIFNIFAAAAGLLLVKGVLIFGSLIERRKNDG